MTLAGEGGEDRSRPRVPLGGEIWCSAKGAGGVRSSMWSTCKRPGFRRAFCDAMRVGLELNPCRELDAARWCLKSRLAERSAMDRWLRAISGLVIGHVEDVGEDLKVQPGHRDVLRVIHVELIVRFGFP